MIRTYGNFTSLSQQNSLALFLAICSAEEPLSFNELRGSENSSRGVRVFLDHAEDDGLIDIEVLSTPVRKFRIIPTAMGREIGTMLTLVDSLVAPGKETREKSINTRYAETVLRSLLVHEPMKQCELLEIKDAYNTISTLMAALEDDGLVTSRRDVDGSVGRPPIMYSLTPTGRTVAKTYRTIFDMIDAKRPKMDDPAAGVERSRFSGACPTSSRRAPRPFRTRMHGWRRCPPRTSPCSWTRASRPSSACRSP